MFLRQRELRIQLQSTLNGGRPGWNNDEPAVVEFASQIVLRQLFGNEYNAGEITNFVNNLRTATEGDPPVDQLNAEALVRDSLGEAKIEVKGISPGQRFLLRALMAATGAYLLDLNEAAVDEIIADSERNAFEQGWKPRIAR